MKIMKSQGIFLLFLFYCLQNIHANEIPDKAIEAYLRAEYNRGFNYYGDISLIGAFELKNMYAFRAGISYGSIDNNTDIKTFTCARVSPFSNTPFEFSIFWIYNGLPEYEIHTHTIMPVFSYNGNRAGISAGYNFRFTSFFGEQAILESVISYSVYFNFINNETLRLGIGGGNFSDFSAKNIGAYSIKLYSAIQIDKNFMIINDIELMQSGGDGLSATFYGFAWRGGVKYSW
jgi:hypothetical protein